MQVGNFTPFEFSEVKDYKTDYFIDTDIVEEDFNIKIKAIMQYKTSKDKVYDYTHPTGFQVYVNNEELALIDNYSGKDLIYLNEVVYKELTETQKDLASAIMLGFYLTYLDNPNIRNSSESWIAPSESTSIISIVH